MKDSQKEMDDEIGRKRRVWGQREEMFYKQQKHEMKELVDNLAAHPSSYQDKMPL